MTTARKVIDWHGQGGEELARQLAGLPAGQYALVPVDELGDADDEELVLSDEETERLVRAAEQEDRGQTVPADEVYARIDARLKARAPLTR